jgi:hypothetical protein
MKQDTSQHTITEDTDMLVKPEIWKGKVILIQMKTMVQLKEMMGTKAQYQILQLLAGININCRWNHWHRHL